MLEWIERNREWVFSGVGVAATLALWGVAKLALSLLGQKRPRVELACGMPVNIPISTDLLIVKFVNETDKAINVDSFVLELEDGQTLYPLTDCMTGRKQLRVKVEPHSTFDFYMSADEIAQQGRKPGEFRCAVVNEATGIKYRSSRRALREKLEALLPKAKN